jgi:CHAD domain-containing protein
MSSLDRSASVADVIGVALSASVNRLVAHEAGVLAGGDPEDVHQARVAARRMRSDLRTFGDFVDEDWATDLRAELRWLGGELGEVRDLEVLLERLRADCSRLASNEQEAAERVIRRLVAEWHATRARMVETLSTPRYGALRDRLVLAAQRPRCTTWANLTAVHALPAVVQRPWRKLRQAVDELGDRPSDEALHSTRIRAKRARYAAEATIPVFARDARRFGRAIARVQEVLGEHHDAVVAHAWISKTAHESSSSEAFAAGMMAEMETRAAEVARADFPEIWGQARRRKLRAWL